jgi:transposase-like protein
MCTNKPLVIVDKGSWYRWAFERLGLEYRYERFCIRNRLKLAMKVSVSQVPALFVVLHFTG